MAETTAAEKLEDATFPPASYSWSVMSVIFVGACFAFVDRIIISLISPALEADLHMTDSQLGLLQGIAFALFYTLFGIPMGLLADRKSRKWILVVGMAGWSLMTCLCGFAKGFGSLFTARLGVGLGEAALNPSTTSLIGDLFPPRKRPRAFSLFVMGTGMGQGISLIVGGALLGWLTTRGGLSLPVLGDFKPWQAMFLIFGIIGLVPAILIVFTVREPARREFSNKEKRAATRQEVMAFIKLNRFTLFCHHLGIAMIVMTAYGFANWMPTFFLRVHGWPTSKFGKIYGTIALVLGVVAPLAVGQITTWLKNRGMVDASWRFALVGAIGCTIAAVAAPLMPNATASLTVYVIAGLFVNPCSVLALLSISEFVPNEFRGTITGMYFLLVGILSTGLGPFAVGAATDFLFQDKTAIGSSLALVSLVTGIPAIVLLGLGLKSFRRSLDRATWVADGGPAARP